MATEITGQVGPAAYFDADRERVFRQMRSGEAAVSELHGRYAETAIRGNIFSASNATAVTTTVTIALTFTGLLVKNPAGSGKNLAILAAGFSLTVAPAGIFTLGLMGGPIGTFFSAETAINVNSHFLNNNMTASAPASVATADNAATIAAGGTPVFLVPLYNGNTSGALPTSVSNSLVPVEGLVVVKPGNYVALYTLTASVGNGAIIWEEVPV